MLLVRDDVGRAKPATRALPPKEVAFGKPNYFNGSAADVIDMAVLREQAQQPSRYNKQPDTKDFRRLNKAVLKEGATTAAVSTFLIYLPILRNTQIKLYFWFLFRSKFKIGDSNFVLTSLFGQTNRAKRLNHDMKLSQS